MKTKQENNHHYTGLAIPVILNNVEMSLINGQWQPNVDNNIVANLLIKQLAIKSSPLNGCEVRFIRDNLGMSLRSFASKVAHESHVAVKKWEDKGLESTNMNFNTEFAIRVYIIDNCFEHLETRLYSKIIKQAKAFYDNQSTVNSVNIIDLINHQNDFLVSLSSSDANHFNLLSNENYDVLVKCADYRNQSIEQHLQSLIINEQQQIEFEKQRIEREKKEQAREAAKTYDKRTTKIGKLFKKHFHNTNYLYHPIDLLHDAQELIEELVQSEIISGKVTSDQIVKSKLMKITRSAYFSFGMEIGHFVGSMVGTKHVFLTSGLFRAEHHCAFVGMPDNIEVSVRLYSILISQAKKAKTEFLKTLSKRMKTSNRSKRVKDYMYDWAQTFDVIFGSDELYEDNGFELLDQFSKAQWNTRD